MTSEQELREKLRKISALFAGATTAGERDAAVAAIGRVQKALIAVAPTEPSVEMHFKFPDHWHRRLFVALCRRHGLEPYRYRRQRHTTVVVRAPDSFINKILWPEFLQIKTHSMSTSTKLQNGSFARRSTVIPLRRRNERTELTLTPAGQPRIDYTTSRIHPRSRRFIVHCLAQRRVILMGRSKTVLPNPSG